MSDSLEGKVAIVTGAASGLGLASALRLAAAGATVVCADVSANGASAAAEKARAAGLDATPAPTDVTRADEVEELVTSTLRRSGRLDVLVNNAGVGSVGSAVETDDAEWDRVLATNLTGMWRCARAVLPLMIEARSGSVVNQASITALRGYPRIAAYSAAKGGVVALTRQMACDVAPHGVRVNAVVPGTVHTPLTQGLWDAGGGFGGAAASPDEQATRAGRGYPLGRLGTADEVAAMVAFLAGDDSRWITGQVHVVDGGRTGIG